jgi:hypothetical protein
MPSISTAIAINSLNESNLFEPVSSVLATIYLPAPHTIEYGLMLAGQEGLEPPTCGFGDRCSTN